jgi:phage terminase large subunit-like protein
VTAAWPVADAKVEDLLSLISRTSDPDDLDALIHAIEAELEWTPWPHQVAPPGDWAVWLLMGGRGSGKTDAGAFDMDEHVKGPPCDPSLRGGHRMSIIAPTLGDAAESCVNGPSGLKAHNPAVRLVSATGGTIARWPNGAEAKLFGGSHPRDVERFRAGGNRCRAWVEEAAAIPYLEAVWEQIPFGHRLGRNPQVVMSTTPKPRGILRQLQEKARAWAVWDGLQPSKRWERVVVTHATTDDNPALDKEVR